MTGWWGETGEYLDRVMRGRTFDNAVDVDLVYRVLGG